MFIRAKFRCMSSTNTWDHHRHYDFLPVTASEGAPENAQFWDATPAGEATLRFKAHVDDEEQFRVGDYYYVDFEPVEDDDPTDWRLDKVVDHGETQQDVVFMHDPRVEDYDKRGPRWGSLEMSVLNPAAFNQFGRAKRPWRVTFTHAGSSRGPALKG